MRVSIPSNRGISSDWKKNNSYWVTDQSQSPRIGAFLRTREKQYALHIVGVSIPSNRGISSDCSAVWKGPTIIMSQSPRIGAFLRTVDGPFQSEAEACLNPLESGHFFGPKNYEFKDGKELSLNPLESGHFFGQLFQSHVQQMLEVSIPSNRGISSDTYREIPCQSRDESLKTTPTPPKLLPVEFLALNIDHSLIITY